MKRQDCSSGNPQKVKGPIIFPSSANSEHRDILNLNKKYKQSSLGAKYITVEIPEKDSPEEQVYQSSGGFLKFTVPSKIRSTVGFEPGSNFFLTKLRGCFRLTFYREGDKFFGEDPINPEDSISIREKCILDDTTENRTHTENHTIPVMLPAIHAFAAAMVQLTDCEYGSEQCRKLPERVRQFCRGGPMWGLIP